MYLCDYVFLMLQDEETLFRKKSNLFCYISAILAVACIGGGVLMGVIYMMVQ